MRLRSEVEVEGKAMVEGEGEQRSSRYYLVKTYWRDCRNPFPGRLVEVKRIKMGQGERAWLDFVRRSMAERDAREWEAWKRTAGVFEGLADSACEGGEVVS